MILLKIVRAITILGFLPTLKVLHVINWEWSSVLIPVFFALFLLILGFVWAFLEWIWDEIYFFLWWHEIIK